MSNFCKIFFTVRHNKILAFFGIMRYLIYTGLFLASKTLILTSTRRHLLFRNVRNVADGYKVADKCCPSVYIF